MDKVRVCVDAVGGDEPAEVVLAGIEAALEADADLEVLVAGPEEVIAEFCATHERAEALVAPEIITMEDDPITAVMTRRKSSIVLGCRAVKKGQAGGFFLRRVDRRRHRGRHRLRDPVQGVPRRQAYGDPPLPDQCAAQSRGRADRAVRHGRQPRRRAPGCGAFRADGRGVRVVRPGHRPPARRPTVKRHRGSIRAARSPMHAFRS